MIRAHSTLSLMGIAVATWMTAGVAAADQPSQMTARKMSASATVEKVNSSKRELSLKDDQGNKFMVQVPDSVSRFDAIKTGDHINVDYYESVALSLKKPSDTQPSANESTMTARAAGNLPGGMVARNITASAEVMKVDKADNKVTIKGPGGNVDTINVSDPMVQADLGKLNKGDRIQARYTEALAISVTPKDK
jgi:hypothetical protein